MKLKKDKKILIIGLGLMGGSYAIRLSEQGYAVRAVDKDPDTIRYGLEQGMIEEGCLAPSPSLLAWADIIVSCLYPRTFIEWVGQYGRWMRKGTLLTDVSGVKSGVIGPVRALLPEGVEFVAAHPMCGREYCGVQYASGNIFDQANYLIVADEENSPEGVAECRALGESLGVRQIAVLSQEEHDSMIAFLSQMTHCIAVALMTCTETRDMYRFTGDSFRELTRIARINEDMWPELFFMNKKYLLAYMEKFDQSFDMIRKAIQEEDAEGLKEQMRLSTRRRQEFDL